MWIPALATVTSCLTLALCAGVVQAQGAYDRCVGGNPAIRGWLERGRFPVTLVHRNPLHALGQRWNTSNAPWATSHLAASARLPASLDAFPGLREALALWNGGRRPANLGPVDSIELLQALWSCQYSPDRLTDLDTSTAWCEGAPGDGVGELVLFSTGAGFQNDPVGFEIRTGFAKSETLFRSNGRPRHVRVWHLGMDSGSQVRTTAAGETIFDGLKVLVSHVVELRDVNGWQSFPFPDGIGGRPGLVVALEVSSVYPGSRYRDTCISEIRVRFRSEEPEL